MILNPWNVEAFKEYARPLRKLEKDLREAGKPVIFHALRDTFGSKYVKVIPGRSAKKFICIEGASPLQAAMKVAKAAGL